jgi:hypothetical protein
LDAEDSEVLDNELIELVLRDVGLEYIPKRAIHVQKYYMRQPRGLYMGINTSVQKFVERLNDFNRYLLYLPEEIPKQSRSQEKRALLNLITQNNILKDMIFFDTKKRSTFLNH